MQNSTRKGYRSNNSDTMLRNTTNVFKVLMKKERTEFRSNSMCNEYII